MERPLGIKNVMLLLVLL